MVSGVRTERDRAGPTGDRECAGDAEHDRVAVRHHRDPHALVSVMAIGNGDRLVRQRRPGENAREPGSVQTDQRPLGIEVGRDPFREVQLLTMALAVVEGDGAECVPLCAERVRHGRRVQATGDDHNRPPRRLHRSLPTLSCTIRGLSLMTTNWCAVLVTDAHNFVIT